MKKLKMLENIMAETCRLQEMASQVRFLGEMPSENFVFCFHTHYNHPTWSVWPIGESSTGLNQAQVKLIDGGLKVSNVSGFIDEDIHEITEELTGWLDENV